MSTPRTKRPFAGSAADPSQRQITSFFGTASAQDGIADTTVVRQPELPSNVQSNLLSVGMRVRKSVPEGYKTMGNSAFKLWTDNTKPMAMTTKAMSSAASSRSTSRELLPFCSINSVGGFDAQPDFEYDDVPALDEVPELTMSQESVESNSASTAPSRKRFYDDNDAEDVPAQNLCAAHARVLAVPRTRSRKSAAHTSIPQETMAVDNDFDDADFLVYSEGEMDMAI